MPCNQSTVIFRELPGQDIGTGVLDSRRQPSNLIYCMLAAILKMWKQKQCRPWEILPLETNHLCFIIFPLNPMNCLSVSEVLAPQRHPHKGGLVVLDPDYTGHLTGSERAILMLHLSLICGISCKRAVSNCVAQSRKRVGHLQRFFHGDQCSRRRCAAQRNSDRTGCDSTGGIAHCTRTPGLTILDGPRHLLSMCVARFKAYRRKDLLLCYSSTLNLISIDFMYAVYILVLIVFLSGSVYCAWKRHIAHYVPPDSNNNNNNR